MSRVIPLMCALASFLALAQKPRVVLVPFVVGDGATEKSAGKWNALLVEELRMRSGNLEYVAPPPTKAAGAGTAGRAAPSAEAIAALDAGKKAFEDLRFEDAVATLKKGIAGVQADPATADFELITDGFVKLAAAQFRMGEEKGAKDTLLELARVSPEYAMPAGFPPVFAREFDKAKRRLDKQPKGTVAIDGPPGSTAFLDGRDLGMVPVEEENVSGGAHSVRVEGTRGERFGQMVTVLGGTVKVKASFGEAAPRQVVGGGKATVADPAITSQLDEGVLARLGPYARAAGADYALVGYLYKTSDTALTVGSALYSAEKQVFTQLSERTIDIDVLTANTESYKLVAEVLQRLQSFGAAATLPVNLAGKAARAGTSTVAARDDAPTNIEDLSVAGPRKKTVLVPKAKPVEPVARPVSELPEGAENLGERPPEEVKVEGGVPAWVWVIVGVGVAAGAGVGIGFGVAEANRPVTGTVTASW